MGSAVAGAATGRWPIQIDYLLVGAGGGGGGSDSSLGSGGGGGGGVTGSFFMPSAIPLVITVGITGNTGVSSATSAAGGNGGTGFSTGGKGGNAGASGSSGGGGGGGGSTGLTFESLAGAIIAVAGGGGGGGGATEGDQDLYGGSGGGIQTNGVNGTSTAGAAGANFSGDGGGAGGGGAGRYGGASEVVNVTLIGASGGGNFHNTAMCSSTSSINGPSGLGQSSSQTTGCQISGGSAWGYANNYGIGRGGASTASVNGGIGIIKYQGSQRFTGGTVSTVSGYTVHTFTANGTLTFTV